MSAFSGTAQPPNYPLHLVSRGKCGRLLGSDSRLRHRETTHEADRLGTLLYTDDRILSAQIKAHRSANSHGNNCGGFSFPVRRYLRSRKPEIRIGDPESPTPPGPVGSWIGGRMRTVNMRPFDSGPHHTLVSMGPVEFDAELPWDSGPRQVPTIQAYNLPGGQVSELTYVPYPPP
jgi:hypothetical protein